VLLVFEYLERLFFIVVTHTLHCTLKY
jgi:hypothetical protein